MEVGLLKFVDPKGIVKEKDNESVKKRKGCDPHGITKKVKLEIESGQKKAEGSQGRGRPKSTDDTGSKFVKKELPDDPENSIFCTKC